jgi:hypothetical protein
MKARIKSAPLTQDPSVELLIKLTDREINLFRLAMSRAAAEEEAKQATKLTVVVVLVRRRR